MLIEKGDKTDEPIRTRGWTHWHHLFHPRQLLLGALYRKEISAMEYPLYGRYLDCNAKLCRWDPKPGPGRAGKIANAFYNQALNTLYNYGCRGSEWTKEFFDMNSFKSFPCENRSIAIHSHPAQELEVENDLYITDPPYGDAVKYEEITEFFIAWLRKNPPHEFAHWTWDSRRSLAIQGQDHAFRQAMVASYQRMRDKMPDNGMQVLMFTHKSGSIWADMANIIWASGLQVTAAWYVVTETDSALRQGANVTGTVLLVLRKQCQHKETFRDDLAWEIQEAVQKQVTSLTGLDHSIRQQGSEGLYKDADIQMAGYAAAMRVLTAYSRIDGKDMVLEAQAPKQKGKKTFVEELLDFAVQTAVQFLVPVGFEKNEWQKLCAVERFYLKMAELEHQGNKTLDNYQNFAKAFQVHHFEQLMSDSSRANSARLKLSMEFKGSLMAGDAEIAYTPLRALLYAIYETTKEIEIEDVLLHLMQNCPNYLAHKPLLANMADYLAQKRAGLKSTKTYKTDAEASAARILAQGIRNQRL
jgi:putative DNA methylase